MARGEIMAKEIERKFLVKSNEWKKSGQPQFYQQAYLVIQKSVTVRVRLIGESAYLTIKNAAINFSRDEFEYKIPLEDARFMIEHLCQKPAIQKYRTKVEVGDFIWEIDEFTGENEGLLIAEIELKNPEQQFLLPDWIGQEVTGDHRYNNSYLVQHPFNKWKKNE